MQKRAIRPGFHDKMVSGNSYKDWLDLTKYVHDVLNTNGYPISGDCCIAPPSSTDVGKVLTIGTDGKIALATVSGVGGAINSIALGTITTSTIQVVVIGGVNFNLPSATSTTAGLMTSVQFNQLASLVTNGLNSTNSITGNGTVATPFKLVNDTATPGNNYYYGTSNTGVKGYQPVKYVQTFTTGTFSTQSFTVSASTHLKGTDLTIQIFELVAGNYEVVTVDKISVDPSGNVTVSVTPGSEFNGKIIIF